MKIREVKLLDLEKLSEIGKQTFSETFASANSETDMAEYLERSFSMETLKSELMNPEAVFYFVEDAEQVIGYLKLNTGRAQTELNDKNSLEIERIYVIKEFQGKKVGQLLFEKAIEVAKMKNVDFLWLGVWEENPKAIQFYKKNGFKAFDNHSFLLGTDEQNDILMKLEL